MDFRKGSPGSYLQAVNQETENSAANTLAKKGLDTTFFAPLTGNTIVALLNKINVINPAATIAALTVTMPAGVTDEDRLELKFTRIVTSITLGGATLGTAAPTSAAVGTHLVFKWDAGTSKWY